MHRAAIRLCLLISFASIAHAQQPAPTTTPAGVATLLNNEVAYPVPPGWKALGASGDDRRAGWQLGNDEALIVVSVSPQAQTIPDALGPKLKAQVLETLKAEAAKGNIETVAPPTVDSDARFLLKVHDVFRTQGKYSNRIQFYRGVGRNLVTVVASSFSEDAEKTKQVHSLGEQIALNVKLNRPGTSAALDQVITMPQGQAPAPNGAAASTLTKPELFKEAKLRIPAPTGWKAEPTSKPSGTIVAWRDPQDSTNLITLTYRPIPPAARNGDDSTRSLAISETARGEKPDFQAAGAKPIGTTQTVTDKRFLRKTKSDYEVKSTKITVGFRQVRAGDGVVSVTSMSLTDNAATIDELADKIATEVRSTGM